MNTHLIKILSRVRGSVTNNIGFWIGWLDLLALLLQSLLITINYNSSNPWLPKTRSVPYWTKSVSFSTVTDLVLIYESVTSSVSVVRWLTLHSWTLNSLSNESCRLPRLLLTNELVDDSFTTESVNYVSSFCNSGRTEETIISNSSSVTAYIRCHGTCSPNRCSAMDYSESIPYCVNVC
jgi:hypothetical protein